MRIAGFVRRLSERVAAEAVVWVVMVFSSMLGRSLRPWYYLPA